VLTHGYRNRRRLASPELVTRACPVCAAPIGEFRRSDTVYCSARCGKEWLRREQAEQLPTRTCRACLAVISKTRRLDTIYCSSRCAGTYRTRKRRCRTLTPGQLAEIWRLVDEAPDPQEIWEPVPGWDGHYEVCPGTGRHPEGQVRRWDWDRFEFGEPVAVGLDSQGYPSANLGRHAVRVHVLILEAFTGPRPPGQEGRHLDDVRTSNRLVNLAWGTRAENHADAVRNGKIRRPSQENRT